MSYLCNKFSMLNGVARISPGRKAAMTAASFGQGRLMSSVPERKTLLLSYRGADDSVALVTFNRPKALNAINGAVLADLEDVLTEVDAHPSVRAIVLTGSEKVFVAGGDVKFMMTKTMVDWFNRDVLISLDSVCRRRRPIIAAVNGIAFGGGFELAMMADIALAGEKAIFSQPEINLGIIPGGGGTQRLTHAVGKSRAMHLCLTGDPISAKQALAWGLVNAVHPPEALVDEAVKLGEKIASKSKVTVQMCKEAINKAYELPLSEGLRFEKRLSNATFATNDRKEGMTAFVEKRPPKFTDS